MIRNLKELHLRTLYEEYVEYFDPTPQYLYDEPYRMMDFEEWKEEYEETHANDASHCARAA